MKMATCQSGGADPYQYKLRWGFSPTAPTAPTPIYVLIDILLI